MIVKSILLSGKKNPDQWTNEEIARACPKHGQGRNFLLYLVSIIYFSLKSREFFVFSSLQQTNTADMLDLAVEYIKDLQKQFKVWKENLN